MGLLNPKNWFKDRTDEVLASQELAVRRLEAQQKLSSDMIVSAMVSLREEMRVQEGMVAKLLCDAEEREAKRRGEIKTELLAVKALLAEMDAGIAARLEVLSQVPLEKHLMFDVQVHEGDGRVTDVRLHGDKGHPWAGSDGKPPFRIEQRFLTPEQAVAMKAGLES